MNKLRTKESVGKGGHKFIAKGDKFDKFKRSLQFYDDHHDLMPMLYGR